jgi:DNA-binding XRE family transcriptional regulator
MTSTEYKAARERLGMTQAALADALDVSRKAINEREAGGTITREVAMALELLALRTTPKRRKGPNAEAVATASTAAPHT